MNKDKLILIVDDKKENMKVLSRILSENSYEIALAGSAKKALHFLQKRKPDLILLDIMMPEMNGFEVCKKVKKDSDTKDIPVIFISALKETKHKLKGFKVGGVDYITKPFHKEEVLARVNTQLEIYEMRQKLEDKANKLEDSLNNQVRLHKLSNNIIRYQKKNKKDFLTKMARDISKLLSIDRVLLANFDLEQEVIIDFIKVGQGKDKIVRPSFKQLNEGLSGWVIKNKEAFFSPVTEQYNEYQNLQVQRNHCEKNCGDIAIIPLINEEKVVGILTVINSIEGKKIKRNDMFILESLSNQIAIAIEEKKKKKELRKANKELKRMVSIDGLTQIANRKLLDETLEKEWNRAKRNKDKLAILMLDIDNFKDYNDLYGHQLGDEALKKLAAVFAEVSFRPSDLAARYGGDEFVIILPDTDLAGAKNVAERVRKQVEELEIKYKISGTINKVTVSIGLAIARPEAKNCEADLIKVADEALYRAKNAGGNQIKATQEIVRGRADKWES